MLSQNTTTTNSASVQNKKVRTFFVPGITCALHTMVGKYTQKPIETPLYTITGSGCNNLPPIEILIDPFIGAEIYDVDFEPYKSFYDYLNPLTVATTAFTKITNWYYGIKVTHNTDATKIDISRHSIKIKNVNVGQDSDIAFVEENYKLWRTAYPEDNLAIFVGVSRGAATAFNALAKNKYPEVKLVILEGCFYSLDDVLTNWVYRPVANIIHKGLSLFTQYKEEGPNPGKLVNDFPENIPVVFITSKVDKIVPSTSTEKLAHALADRGKNPVYLLVLDRSSHPNYMYDCEHDRKKYETLIHAVYEKYGFPFIPELAEAGRHLLEECLVKPNIEKNNQAAQRCSP